MASSTVGGTVANEVPDVVTLAQSDGILRDQVLAMYQVDSLEQARAHYEQAMTR